MMQKQLHHRFGLATARRRPAVWLALFAMLLQAFVVQTHVHHAGADQPFAVSASVSSSAHANELAFAPPSAKTADCLLCQALAGSGRAVLPEGVALPEIRAVLVRAIAGVVAFAAAPPAHPWQSRGPPSHL
ncbi:MAG: hypothetical protein ABUS48_03850 [Pseudomonadota bacterium]